MLLSAPPSSALLSQVRLQSINQLLHAQASSDDAFAGMGPWGSMTLNLLLLHLLVFFSGSSAPAKRASVVRRADDKALQTLQEENELLRRTIEAADDSIAEVEKEIKKLGIEVYALLRQLVALPLSGGCLLLLLLLLLCTRTLLEAPQL